MLLLQADGTIGGSQNASIMDSQRWKFLLMNLKGVSLFKRVWRVDNINSKCGSHIPENWWIGIISVCSSHSDEHEKNGKLSIFRLKEKSVSVRYNTGLQQKIQDVIECFKPDIIDVQGIEFSFSKAVSKCQTDCPVLYTLQGLPAELSKVYQCGEYPLRYFYWVVL